ncbi:beta-aspartyl-peptidase, partial [bacterium]
GDSPIVGAGVYANNATCAVSSTGHGEHFLCNVVAYDISAMMEYKGLTVQEAAEEVVMKKLVQRNGFGGVIAVGKDGQATMTFNAAGMYRGHIDAKGEASVDIFK